MDYDVGDRRDGLRRVTTLELAIAGAAPGFCFPAPGKKARMRVTNGAKGVSLGARRGDEYGGHVAYRTARERQRNAQNTKALVRAARVAEKGDENGIQRIVLVVHRSTQGGGGGPTALSGAQRNGDHPGKISGQTKPGTYIHSEPRHIQPTGGTFGAAAGTFPECVALERMAGTLYLPPRLFNFGTFMPSIED
ncbi:hypothetical protein B0H13DRAFT_1874591 [Mycena leptocephala]|nr:hypothetical protein B0H13DRAFT_1874591 [Mycena leptocephala]